MVKSVENALEYHPFKTGERDLITVNAANDFKYRGNTALTTHILYNLIRNSLRAIMSIDKGKITITLESDKNSNRLIFRDTASGIKKGRCCKKHHN